METGGLALDWSNPKWSSKIYDEKQPINKFMDLRYCVHSVLTQVH